MPILLFLLVVAGCCCEERFSSEPDPMPEVWATRDGWKTSPLPTIVGKNGKEYWTVSDSGQTIGHYSWFRGEWQCHGAGCSCTPDNPKWEGDWDDNGCGHNCTTGGSPGGCNCVNCLCPGCGYNPNVPDHPNKARNERLQKLRKQHE